MPDAITNNALISLSGRFVEAFVSGEKCVELRRRRPDIRSGAYVWFYSKVPDGRIRAYGVVSSVEEFEREKIWSEFGNCLALTQSEFSEYLGDREKAYIIRFQEIWEMKEPISLKEIRHYVPRFQPPQFFSYIRSEALLEILSISADRSARVDHPL